MLVAAGLTSRPCTQSRALLSLSAAVLTGVVAFGWHSYHRGRISILSTAPAAWATLGAGGYLAVCLLSLGPIVVALAALLPRSVEALGISAAFLIGSVMTENVRALHAVAVHAATVVVSVCVARAVLRRRDPAA